MNEKLIDENLGEPEFQCPNCDDQPDLGHVRADPVGDLDDFGYCDECESIYFREEWYRPPIRSTKESAVQWWKVREGIQKVIKDELGDQMKDDCHDPGGGVIYSYCESDVDRLIIALQEAWLK